MDQSKALQRLTESADLVGMIEDLMRASQSDRLAPATVSGMRITLRNIREAILASHDVFANDLVTRTRSRGELTAGAGMQSSEVSSSTQSSTSTSGDATYGATGSGVGSVMSDASRLGIRRQNLRASLEKVAE